MGPQSKTLIRSFCSSCPSSCCCCITELLLCVSCKCCAPFCYAALILFLCACWYPCTGVPEFHVGFTLCWGFARSVPWGLGVWGQCCVFSRSLQPQGFNGSVGPILQEVLHVLHHQECFGVTRTAVNPFCCLVSAQLWMVQCGFGRCSKPWTNGGGLNPDRPCKRTSPI